MHQEDYISRDGAEKLAQRIRDYWKARGVHVRVWVEETKLDSGVARSHELHRIIYAVRSSLNGSRVQKA